MSVQLTVETAQGIGRPGMEYDSSAGSDVVTKIASETIQFGAWVVFTDEDGCEIPDSAAEVTNSDGGIALLNENKASGSTGYVAGDPVRVMVRGRCFVRNEEAVVNTDPVFVTHTAGGTPGDLRNDANTATAASPPKANWFKGGAINSAVLEVGGPVVP